MFDIHSSFYSFADNPTLIQGAGVVACGGTYTLYGGACKKAGLSDTDIAIVSGIQVGLLNLATAGVGSAAVVGLQGTAATASAIVSGATYAKDAIALAPRIGGLLNGTLNTREQLDLMRDLSLELLHIGVDHFVEKYAGAVGTTSAKKVAAIVANRGGTVALGSTLRSIGVPATAPSQSSGGVGIKK